MKINRIIVIVLLLLITNIVSATTAADRSDITIFYRNSGWNGINAGWQEDEWLISPNHTLSYDFGETNHGPEVTDEQYKIAPVFKTNWGEMTNNQFSPNDEVLVSADPDGTDGDISELWLTWDSEWIYCAVKAEMKNQFQTGIANSGVNLAILFSRVREFGIQDFIQDAVWKKSIFTRDFYVDFYVGAYGGWGTVPHAALGGFQLRNIELSGSTFSDNELAKMDINNSEYINTNIISAFYNGEFESDSLQRVFLTKFRIDDFTNTLESVSSITLRIMIAAVDGADNEGSWTYDFCPNNLAGMNKANKTVADNYFEIPFTDVNGEVILDISPRYEAKINFLPGSRPFFIPSFETTNHVESGSSLYSRSIFAPQEGEEIHLGIKIPKKTNVFEGSIEIYSLSGEKIRSVVSGQEWTASNTEDFAKLYPWDGEDEDGNIVAMGNYVVVYKGKTEAFQEFNTRQLIAVIH